MYRQILPEEGRHQIHHGIISYWKFSLVQIGLSSAGHRCCLFPSLSTSPEFCFIWSSGCRPPDCSLCRSFVLSPFLTYQRPYNPPNPGSRTSKLLKRTTPEGYQGGVLGMRPSSIAEPPGVSLRCLRVGQAGAGALITSQKCQQASCSAAQGETGCSARSEVIRLGCLPTASNWEVGWAARVPGSRRRAGRPPGSLGGGRTPFSVPQAPVGMCFSSHHCLLKLPESQEIVLFPLSFMF